MSSANSYYYNLLNKEQQKAYYAIKEGLSKLESYFAVPRLESLELSRIFSMVRLDNPEIFYAGSYKFRYYDHADHIEFIPEYIMPVGKLKSHIQAMNSRITKIVRGAEGMNDIDKEKYVHDFVIGSVTYDKLKKAYSHEIIGALGNGVAVCEGIAKAVKAIFDKLGIWCVIAISQANKEEGVKYRHAWNIVKINGKYYHLDVTFDNTLSKDGVIRYDYFNLSDDMIFRDHQKLIWPMPKCKDGKNFYYLTKKLSFTKVEDIGKRSLQAAKKGRNLVFNWRGGYLSKDQVEEFFHIMKEEGEKKNKTAIVKINWPQAVFSVRYEDKVSNMDNLEFEEANEGELYDVGECAE